MAFVKSSEYPNLYYDPKVFEKWEKRFGLEFRLLIDAIFYRNFMSENCTPVYIMFNGEPSFMPAQAKLKVTPPKYNNEEKETPWGRIFGKETLGRRTSYVIYGMKPDKTAA